MNDNKKAFPGDCQTDTTYNIHEGMDLRDYFAAKAMQSLILSATKHEGYGEDYPENNKILANVSYILADNMMEVRKNGK